MNSSRTGLRRGENSSPSYPDCKPQLILDIGGVLATNISPLFWELVAEDAGVASDVIYRLYKAEVSERLWTGEVTEEQFWSWLGRAAGLERQQGQAYLSASLAPLPALQHLKRWSEIANIHLLSNHLISWVEPLLKEVRPYITSATISSLVGCRKPDRGIFDCAAGKLRGRAPTLFIDDQSSNLDAAAETAGWSTLLADPEGHWITAADRWLREASEPTI
ncbi:hypothetical protein [Paenibacillus sp. PL2-23]|uniref:hypothetical protein n=1 Tax=Paenibacillus sp. PL2-23 TaxID=2100729 RepID=UPI0030F830DC